MNNLIRIDEATIINAGIVLFPRTFEKSGLMNFLYEMTSYFMEGTAVTFEARTKMLAIKSKDISVTGILDSKIEKDKMCIQILHTLGIIKLQAEDLKKFELNENLEQIDLQLAPSFVETPVVEIGTLEMKDRKIKRSVFNKKMEIFCAKSGHFSKRKIGKEKIFEILEKIGYFMEDTEFELKKEKKTAFLVDRNAPTKQLIKIDKKMARYLCELDIISPENLRDIYGEIVEQIAIPHSADMLEIARTELTTFDALATKFEKKFPRRGKEYFKGRFAFAAMDNPLLHEEIFMVVKNGMRENSNAILTCGKNETLLNITFGDNDEIRELLEAGIFTRIQEVQPKTAAQREQTHAERLVARRREERHRPDESSVLTLPPPPPSSPETSTSDK
jgi:hypothetical protein